MAKQKITWKTEKRKIKDLKPYDNNPRRISEKMFNALKRSIEETGYAETITINQDNTIIAGHQRYRAIVAMGVKLTDEIDVRVPSEMLSEAQVRKYLLVSNKITGEWDFDMLLNEFEEDELWDAGFEPEEFTGYDDVEEIESEDEEQELSPPDEEKEAVTKLGDLYHLNNHRLKCGDSTLPEVVTDLLGDDEPILMVTDPPYGVEYDASWRQEKNKGKTANGKVLNDDKINWSLAYYLFPGSVAYVWHAGFHCAEVYKSLNEAEFDIAYQIIWAKQHLVLGRGDYHWKHEPCFYAIKRGHKHNWQGARDQTTVWEISNLNMCSRNKDEGEERTSHSTQKPVECMLRPIKNNTEKGEGVYDPFLGSGTTLIAAEMSGRTCYGVELSPHYCDIIIDRWKKFMQKHNRSYTIKKNGEVIDG